MKTKSWQPAVSLAAALVFCMAVIWTVSAQPLDALSMNSEQRKVRNQVDSAGAAAHDLFDGPVQRFGAYLRPSSVACERSPMVSSDSADCHYISRIEKTTLTEDQLMGFIDNARALMVVAEDIGWRQDEINKSLQWSGHQEDILEWVKKGPVEVRYKGALEGVLCSISLSVYADDKPAVTGTLYCAKGVNPAGLPRGSA